LPVPRLDTRIPETGFAHPDEALDAFLAWVGACGLTLYPHQEEAILSIFGDRHVVLDTPTGSGKSLVATAQHFKSFCDLGKSWYTAPIKALVSEKFFALCDIFGPEHVGLMTGDGSVNRDAPIVCCTAEVLANVALREGASTPAHSVVMDEFHYYGDRDRGMAWQIPLLTLTNTRFLLMSATLGDTRAIREDLAKRTGREVDEVSGVHRPVPLEYRYSLSPLTEVIGELVRTGQAPVYLVHFTQNEATEAAQALMSTDWCTKEEKRAILDAMAGFSFHSPFGPTLRRFLAHGIGLHHAGLLPRYRLLVEKLAQKGLLKLICGTDTLGVGINVPIRTVLFTKLCKFDGKKVDILKVRDFRQIAGRAGRAGFDTTGTVVVQAPEHVIENRRAESRINDPKKLRKLVKAKPPEWGYKHWDETTFAALRDRPPEALVPHFAVDHGRLLSLMQHADEHESDAQAGASRFLQLIDASHVSAAEREALRASVTVFLQDLLASGVARHEGHAVRLEPTLQRDFSLHHSLSLFLVGAIGNLDPASPTRAHDILTWIEAILEDPRAVLQKQTDRVKAEKMAELKAAGVPFEERIAALEGLSYPQPFADQIVPAYAHYVEQHPWMKRAGIRPKSVAREMAEAWMGFPEYVHELGLQRSEGVLLRYLSEVYKALVQNVPAELRDEATDELTAWLRALLGRVDSSLVSEWERLLTGADQVAEPPPVDISAHRKAFHARVRAELHNLVRALSRRDAEEFVSGLRVRDHEWTASELEPLVGALFETVGTVRFDHAARLTHRTVIQATGPHQWSVRQALLGADDDEEEGGTWAIEARIDLRDDTNPQGPLLEFVTIGE
jgi:hypothetical protein